MPVLELRGIEKRFGPVAALRGVDFSLERGTVHALLGENGAGKSTLMRITYGLLHADGGEIAIDGKATTIPSPRVARAHGIGMVHQHFTSVPALTVAENIRLAGGDPRITDRSPRALRTLLSGLALGALVEDLSVGLKQQLEIVKALAGDARILLLDEPTAVLAPSEVDDLISTLRSFVAEGGSVVFITHKLDEALRAADFVTVLRQGRVTLSAGITGQTEERLAHAMIGEDLGPGTIPEARPVRGAGGGTELALVMENATVAAVDGRGPGLQGASLSVSPGELVGVAAIEGNGQRELMLVIAGALSPASGRVETAQPVALVPEDRTTEGLIPELSLSENVQLAAPGREGRWIDWPGVRRRTADLLTRFDVRAPSPDVPAAVLSGGNQQKLILGRALEQQPRVLVAENPTRGLDIRATVEIHRRLREAAAAGVAVILYSSDLDEVLDLAQRIVVLANGRLSEMRMPVDRNLVGRAMLAVSPLPPLKADS